MMPIADNTGRLTTEESTGRSGNMVIGRFDLDAAERQRQSRWRPLNLFPSISTQLSVIVNK